MFFCLSSIYSLVNKSSLVSHLGGANNRKQAKAMNLGILQLSLEN
ncbi:Hypothetical protein CCH01_012000 [Clostridium chauvoei JF4335]|nr:Hypothetical protein CCH01_012000 [Clostridium chauvoei JF4335]